MTPRPATALKIVEDSTPVVSVVPATTKKPAKKIKLPKPSAVLAYLQANPAFLEKHKHELAQNIKNIGKSKKVGNILSLHAAKAEKVQREAESLKVRHKQLISTARGNAEIAESIFNVILKLVACRTLTGLRKYLQTGMTEDLQLEAVRLFKVGSEETATTLTLEQIQSLCSQPTMLQPLNAAHHRILFGPKTNNLRSVCLMALAEDDGTLHGLLALGSADETRFHAGQATTLANFLRRAATSVLAHAG